MSTKARTLLPKGVQGSPATLVTGDVTINRAVSPLAAIPYHQKATCEETISESRLQSLSQEIVDWRETLYGIEDWEVYERAPIIHEIVVRERERSRIVREHNQGVRREQEVNERSTRQTTAARDEIDWVEHKLSVLRASLRASSAEGKNEIRQLIKGYSCYWNELTRRKGCLSMARTKASAKVRTVQSLPGIGIGGKRNRTKTRPTLVTLVNARKSSTSPKSSKSLLHLRLGRLDLQLRLTAGRLLLRKIRRALHKRP